MHKTIKKVITALAVVTSLAAFYQVGKLSDENEALKKQVTALQENNATLESENSYLRHDNEKVKSIETNGITITTEKVAGDPAALDIVITLENGKEFSAYDTEMGNTTGRLSLIAE